MAILVESIEISAHVRAKINGKHGVSEDDVVHAVEYYRAAAWDHDDVAGTRLLVRGPTSSGRTLRVVLYPIDEEAGTWRLATAFF